MRLVWVQQWAVLPVIVEDREMVEDNGHGQSGRLPPGGQAMDPSARARLSDREGPLPPPDASHGNLPYEFQLQGATPQQQIPGLNPFNLPGQQQSAGYQLGRGQSPGAFGMSGMVAALQDYHSSTPSQMSHFDQQQFLAGTPSGASPLQSQQHAGQSSMNPAAYPMHPSQYPPAYQQAFGQMQPTPPSHSGGLNPVQSPYNGSAYYSAQQQQYMYYPGQYGQSGQPQRGTYPTAYGSGPNQGFGQQTGEMSAMGGRALHSGYSPGAAGPFPYGTSGSYLRPGSMPAVSRVNSSSSTLSIPSTPRGPPRKPKQSGHALWVGNLPSGTVVSDLKDHFSRDATKVIDSVFLISKSNCAFVNYRTEAACAAAMTRFHDSRFQGVRLVCRLRRNSSASSTPGAPVGPAALMPSMAYTQTAFEAITQNREVSSKASEDEALRSGDPNTKVKDKYFVMKSLTVEDMELSVRNGIWATQSHNEDALNKAYKTAEKVYLIFSANKSGEYFGYARMASPITDEAAEGLDWAPRGETMIDDPDVPRSIPTAPTEFAPKGRIIDDSARGTIFWEADPEDEELAQVIDHECDDPEEVIKGEEKGEEVDEAAISSETQAFGKPFKIEWLATNRLPFYRTRGLRNPWNANREVKIARDGTELETSVGRRLVQMFQKGSTEGQPQPMGWVPERSY
ncbi:hypothetical protein N7G274_001465 [Stereocaulon virgatum]|uniref:YTH domain-containing protein n=1 Tax=Stereocaulon virgatum TaxID=373712 RepID=A0ABR4AJR4_9LECA